MIVKISDREWWNNGGMAVLPDVTPERPPYCSVTHRASRYGCTRPPGHTGRHAAGDGTQIVAVWP